MPAKREKKFQRINNTLIRDVKDNAADRITLEIGDSKQADFYPQAKIARWDNEVNFSIRRDNGARSFVERDNKIVAESVKEDVVISEDEEGEGGFSIELVLKEPPETNRFEFTIQTKGLDFFYQPALTPEEIEQGAFRPENVVDSYAVYHATKRNNRFEETDLPLDDTRLAQAESEGRVKRHNGKTYVLNQDIKGGKFGHLFRTEAIDANGNKTWGGLEVDTETGILTKTVPPKWLANAVYPVTIR